jgi:hypothetical protein
MWHVAPVAERRGAYRVLVGKPVRDHLEALRVDGRLILKWMIKDNIKMVLNRMGQHELEYPGSGQGQEPGCCEHG